MVMSASRDESLRRAVTRTAPGLSPAAFVRAASNPLQRADLVDRLIDEVTTQETAFLRDRGQLDEIPWHSLQATALAAGAGTIRVWSAGCATGEEAYTLAMLADEGLAPQQAPVEVLGTDISPAALEAARAGRYRERTVRPLSPQLRRRYLEQQADGSYAVTGHLRARVRFRRHNLVRDPFPPAGERAFDVIVCRNVLIYFGEPSARHVIGLLERALRPGGMLVLGAADALHRSADGRRVQRPCGGTMRSALGVRCHRPRHEPPPSAEQRLAAALTAAGAGNRSETLAQVKALLAGHPLDAHAHFLHGLVALEAGDAVTAVAALRRALYIDAEFALAAFTLGRAHDALGDATAARRAYQQALHTLNPDDHRHELLLQQVDMGDIAAACRVRLEGWS